MKFLVVTVFCLVGITTAVITVGYLRGQDETVQPVAVEFTQTHPSSPITQSDDVINSLLDRLEKGEREREQLFTQIKTLNSQLAALGAGEKIPESQSIDSASVAQPEPSSDLNSEDLMGEFLNVGFDQDRAAELISRSAEIDMERLYLRDQASRENWLDSERYSEALRKLENRSETLRDELGDDEYDRYLYASGGSNRIRIDSIIEGSPAQLAGLRPGDTIRSYNGAAVFSIGEVQVATKGGQYGELIPVEIVRNGETSLSYIPRGPLGVTLRARRQRPD